MATIAVLLSRAANARLVAQALDGEDLHFGDPRALRPSEIDLVIVDGVALGVHHEWLERARAAAAPVLIPVLLVTSRRATQLAHLSLWRIADELITMPVDRLELSARVEILLRMRRFSLALRDEAADLEMFVQTAAHDLRSPLTTILGNAEFAASHAGASAGTELRASLTDLATASRQLDALVRDLYAYARAGASPVSASLVEIEPIVDAAAARVASELASTGARLDIRRPLGSVRADPAALTFAVQNLLANAVKYTAGDHPPDILVRADHTCMSTRLLVEDRGPGVPDGQRDQIFDAFLRLPRDTALPGTGIGLAIVRRVARRAGGDAGVDPRRGGGSSFWIEIPAHRASTAHHPHRGDRDDAHGAGARATVGTPGGPTVESLD